MTSSPGSAGEPDAVLHAVLVSVNGLGVLLTGEAGTGKSSCAL
jgi:serine kinase of HPr protein (carbohydrate metabolism regulator)